VSPRTIRAYTYDGAARIVAKGRRELVLPIGAKAARDVDRYIRLRAAQPHAADPSLWLGKKGRLTRSGIYQMVKDRAIRSDFPSSTPTSYAIRSSTTGERRLAGERRSEGDLRCGLVGWKSRAMLTRYAVSAADERRTRRPSAPIPRIPFLASVRRGRLS
jgi:integrase